MSTADVYSLLATVHDLLKKSTLAYQQYIKEGRIFARAKDLRYYNDQLQELLKEKKHLLDDHLQQSAAALIEHYSIWTEKWDTHAKKLDPKDEDEFAFPNEHTFPKQAGRDLEEAFQALA